MSIVWHEGPFGLFKGLIPQLMPEKAIWLFIVNHILSLLATNGVNYPIELLAGLAGANQGPW